MQRVAGRPWVGQAWVVLAGLLAACWLIGGPAAAADPPRLATFRCDVTPPAGQPLFSGDALTTVDEPLLAKGIVIESQGSRHVVCAVDWCLISNGSHRSMCRRIAEAVAAAADHVAVQTLHQHNAPMADIDAQRILAQHGDATAHVDPEWLEATERRIAAAAADAIGRLEPFDRVGVGQGRVERVASNRRVRDGRGDVAGRTSLAAPALRELPEGEVDPIVKTITFAAGDRPLARMHYYATHPQVKYGNGVATSDFVGMARETLEDREGVFQIYFTGCAGDITVGKYNDGTAAARRMFADRLLDGMTSAIEATAFEPVNAVSWRTLAVVLPRRNDAEFTAEACLERIRDPRSTPVRKLYLSAMRMASSRRADEPVVISCLEAGKARIINLPGEPLIEFQRHAQGLLPDACVAVAGYGDNTTGYIPPAAEFAAGGYEPSVALCSPEAEGILKRAMAGLLQTPPASRPAVERLQRIPPREPSEAATSFQCAPGYRIEQLAAEPLVRSPVAADFDADGRLFVVEMIDYSERAHDRLGTVRILDDADGDGRFDSSTVFARELSWPTGVLCYDGGAFVCAAPDILYLKDTDGDGAADLSRVVFTGFGRSNVQGLLNSLRWSLDCRVHGATSSAGASRVIRPDQPSAPPVNLDGRDFSFDPRALDLRPESGCLQHGMSFDDWGRKFVSGNSQPLEMVFFEDRYAARNPLFVMPPSRGSIARGGGTDDVFRASPVEPWRILRTEMRLANPALGKVEGGGRPAGYFTGASGVTAYRGDAFPAEMRECLVVGDVGGNLVHRERLAPAGAFLDARRIDDATEFVRSDDIWFRPAQFANAPDGSLVVIDVYREVIEHPKSLPPGIKEQLDLASGSDRGRIYRVVPDGFTHRPAPRLASASAAELVQALAHRNGWHRDTAARLLFERQDQTAAPALARLARESTLPEGRVHALYVLAALGGLTADAVIHACGNTHPRVREHAVRLAERLADSPEVLTRLCGMTDDADDRVRYQLAFSLGEFPSTAARDAALARLAIRDGGEDYPRAAVFTSLHQGGGSVLEILAANREYAESPDGGRMLGELAFQIGRQLQEPDVRRLERVLEATLAQADAGAVPMLAGFLAGRDKAPPRQQQAMPLSPAVEAARRRLLEAARALALDEAAAEEDRVDAIARLAVGTFAESAGTFATLFETRQPQAVQLAAVACVGALGDAAAGRWLLDLWPRLSPKLRASVGSLLFTREPWVLAFFDAVETEAVPLADFDPAAVRLLGSRKERTVRDRYRRLAARVQASPRQEVLEAYKPALELEGDAEKGRAHFTAVCSQCHKVGDVGHEVGPNLAAFKSRGPEAILLNVLDPNREVNPLYVNYVAHLTDGRTLSGMIADESASSITLRRGAGASDTVARVDVESLASTGQSIMPEGIEKQLDQQAIADLLAFLGSLP